MVKRIKKWFNREKVFKIINTEKHSLHLVRPPRMFFKGEYRTYAFPLKGFALISNEKGHWNCC